VADALNAGVPSGTAATRDGSAGAAAQGERGKRGAAAAYSASPPKPPSKLTRKDQYKRFPFDPAGTRVEFLFRGRGRVEGLMFGTFAAAVEASAVQDPDYEPLPSGGPVIVYQGEAYKVAPGQNDNAITVIRGAAAAAGAAPAARQSLFASTGGASAAATAARTIGGVGPLLNSGASSGAAPELGAKPMAAEEASGAGASAAAGAARRVETSAAGAAGTTGREAELPLATTGATIGAPLASGLTAGAGPPLAALVSSEAAVSAAARATTGTGPRPDSGASVGAGAGPAAAGAATAADLDAEARAIGFASMYADSIQKANSGFAAFEQKYALKTVKVRGRYEWDPALITPEIRLAGGALLAALRLQTTAAKGKFKDNEVRLGTGKLAAQLSIAAGFDFKSRVAHFPA